MKALKTRTLYNNLVAGVGSQQVSIPMVNCRLTGIMLSAQISYAASSYGFVYITRTAAAGLTNGIETFLAAIYLAANSNAAGNDYESIFIPLSIKYGKFPDNLYMTVYSSAAATSITATGVCYFEE